jgi:Fe-S-cluster containining protein
MTIKWRCTQCGECCKRYVPLALPVDIRRIQQRLNKPISEFVEFYRPTDFQPPLGESDERLFNSKFGKLAIVLARVDTEEGGQCTFLKNNVCSVHEFKPHICRQYPFQPVDFDNPKGAFRLIDEPCFGNHATDGEVEEGPVRRDYVSYNEAQEAYNEQVRRWNEEPSSRKRRIEDFLKFVGLEWG